MITISYSIYDKCCHTNVYEDKYITSVSQVLPTRPGTLNVWPIKGEGNRCPVISFIFWACSPCSCDACGYKKYYEEETDDGKTHNMPFVWFLTLSSAC